MNKGYALSIYKGARLNSSLDVEVNSGLPISLFEYFSISPNAFKALLILSLPFGAYLSINFV